jgi:hypothetical protein
MCRLGWLGALGVLALCGTACGDPCGKAEERVVPLSEMPCSMTSADGVWESHPFPQIVDEQCYWLEFRGCSRYDIEHPLGREPTLVVGYTSFELDGSFSTIGSGNSFVVQETSDSTVTIRNAQNQLFYLRLVLE